MICSFTNMVRRSWMVCGQLPISLPANPIRGTRFVLCLVLTLAAIPVGRARGAQPDERTHRVSDSLPFGMSQGSSQYLDLLERYLTLIEKFARMAEDPGAAGSAAALSAKDLLVSDGDTSKAIDYFIQILPEVKNLAVQRTIRIELVDLYKHAGQKDKALEQLRILMISAPAESEGHTRIWDAASPGR